MPRAAVVLLAFVASCALAPRASRPPAGQPFCIAPTPGEGVGGALWKQDSGSLRPSAEVVGRLFAGTWNFVVVTTEAVDAPTSSRRTLRLVPTDSSRRTACPLGRCRAGLSFPASGRFLDAARTFDSAAVARHLMRDDRDVDVRYDEQNGAATLTIGPPAFDAGEFYGVTAFSDSAFEGRWEGGGFVALLTERGGVVVAEHPAGYFCARRVSQ